MTFIGYFIAFFIGIICVVATLALAAKCSQSDKLADPYKLLLLVILSVELALIASSFAGAK